MGIAVVKKPGHHSSRGIASDHNSAVVSPNGCRHHAYLVKHKQYERLRKHIEEAEMHDER